MKSLTLLSFTLLILMTIGCEESAAQNKKYGDHEVYQAVVVQRKNKSVDKQAPKSPKIMVDKITMHPLINPKTGKASQYIPFPSSWKFVDGAAFGESALKGPNGLAYIVYPPQSYIYTNNEMMNQTYQSNGVQVMAPAGIENVLTQLIIPQGQQMGMKLIKQYPLPELAANDREYAKKLLGGYSPQNIYQAIGTDWEDSKGNKVLVVLNYFESISNNIINWGYRTQMLKVLANFEQVKQQFIFGMANRVFNQNEVNAFNKQLAEKLKAQEDHASAMRKINSDGARKRSEMEAATSEEIHNTQIEGYEKRAHDNEVLQEQRSNALNNVNVVISPYDGKEYQVESGHKSYWINNEGKYIHSDDPLFDPNKYEDRTGVWKKAPMKVYK